MNKKYRNKNKKKYDVKNQIIKRQIDEIDNLKKTVSKLEISCEEKDKIIDSIDVLYNDLLKTIDDLKVKGNEYDKLISELSEMKTVMNQIVFKGKWKIIKLLIR